MEPTEEDLKSPEFNAVWNAIKKWDLEREVGAGYAGATGTDVMTILEALRNIDPQEMANSLSPEVVYFAGVRMAVHATVSLYINQEVPKLIFMDAAKRWYDDHKLEC